MNQAKIKNIISLLFSILLFVNLRSQDTVMMTEPDSLAIVENSSVIQIFEDSLINKQIIIASLKKEINNYTGKTDDLKNTLFAAKNLSNKLSENNKELNKKITELSEDVNVKDSLVENQIASLRETEAILAEKEQIYKNLLYDYKMDSLELSMKLQSKNIELKSQKNITSIIEQSITEKKKEIEKNK